MTFNYIENKLQNTKKEKRRLLCSSPVDSLSFERLFLFDYCEITQESSPRYSNTGSALQDTHFKTFYHIQQVVPVEETISLYWRSGFFSVFHRTAMVFSLHTMIFQMYYRRNVLSIFFNGSLTSRHWFILNQHLKSKQDYWLEAETKASNKTQLRHEDTSKITLIHSEWRGHRVLLGFNSFRLEAFGYKH